MQVELNFHLMFLSATVPDKLKKLVHLIARAFYQPLQIVCLDILTKYPW